MKTLHSNILIYDAECPMCRLYSQGFIQAGMLDENGRMDYCQMKPEVAVLIDVKKAKNEIALVDTQTQTVKYGVQSLFHIIGNSFPLLQKLFDFPPFHQVMKRVYAFVSYNRRVIICSKYPDNPSACSPDFNKKYRIAYLVFAWALSSLILHSFTPQMGNWWTLPQGYGAEAMLVIGQMVFQSLVLWAFAEHIDTQKWLDYLGNLMTVSLMGSLLLVPSFIIPTLPVHVYVLWFALVAASMFFEHKRRVRAHHLPTLLGYTWLIYRVLVSILYY